MDDYSRFITGIELFRSQTSQAVIEVYRRAVAEYGTPKEMLPNRFFQNQSCSVSVGFVQDPTQENVTM